MFYLQNVFFYLKLLKKKIFLGIKETYFKSESYQKSLKSKIPAKLDIFLNSFLLSSFTNYENFIFKVSVTDASNFWLKNISNKKDLEIHNFFWLSLIDRKDEASSIRIIIENWLIHNRKYNSLTWSLDLVSKRIISWILNSDIILDSKNLSFKKEFIEAIIIQTNHIKKNFKSIKNYENKIEVLTAIYLSGIVFSEYENNLHYAAEELEKVIKDYYDEDGFPLSRNPKSLLKTLKYLILLNECLNDSNKYVPEYLTEIVEKKVTCLRSIITPEKKLPLFNGSTDLSVDEFEKYLSGLKLKSKKNINEVGGINIIKFKKDYIYFDIGASPKKNLIKFYQCGPLSMEYFFENKKVITNCGFGSGISNKIKNLSKLTSAQSSISINDESVVLLNKNNTKFKEDFKILNIIKQESDNLIICSASHNAYEKRFGCIINRKLEINKKDGNIYGYDEIFNNLNYSDLKFDIRFHLFPGINVIKTMSGQSLLIQIKKNKSLLFSASNIDIKIEEGIFMGKSKILKNFCITLSGRMDLAKRRVNWSLKRNLEDEN